MTGGLGVQKSARGLECLAKSAVWDGIDPQCRAPFFLALTLFA